MKGVLKKNLLAGLLVTVPAALTYIVLAFVVNGVDGVADHLVQRVGGGLHIPGLGFLVIFLFILLVGLLGSNFIGARIITLWDLLMHKIPIVRGIYLNSKNVVDTISRSEEPLFKKLALVDFPGENTKAIGIVCCNSRGEIAHVIGKDLVNVYILSTPNFTSGYLLFVPKERITSLDLSVEEGLATVVSLGTINPQTADHVGAPLAAPS